MTVTRVTDSDLDVLAIMAAQGQGTALKEFLQHGGLEARIRLLNDLSRRSRLLHRANKNLSVLKVFVDSAALADRRTDPSKRYLEVRFSKEVLKLMEGDWIYMERIFLLDFDVHREVRYRDLP